MPLNAPRQPVVRVSWQRAMAFCAHLSERTGKTITLPTEAQWEWACRAGSAAAMSYGALDADFSPWANVGDKAFSAGLQRGGAQITGGLTHFVLEGAALCDTRFSDKAVATAPVGTYRPNARGLYDMHGNAAEWTRTAYRPYPYADNAGEKGTDTIIEVRPHSEDRRSAIVVSVPFSPFSPAGRKAVRGGSFFDAPKRCRSAFRLGYPAWQRVFNVGFRVVCRDGNR